MTSRRGWRFPLALAPRTDVPIGRQVAAALRTAVLSQQLPPGSRVPSTRELARELGVSRNTILDAYGQLLSEGHFEARPGSGTFVAAQLPSRSSAHTDPIVRPPARLSARGRHIVASYASVSDDLPRPFSPGLPFIDSTLLEAWSRTASRVRRHLTASDLSYGEAAGYYPLKRAIASYVAASRGVRCTAAQVIICAGAQLAIAAAARLLVDPGNVIWMEDPGYSSAKAALGASGASLAPVAVDDEGMRVDDALRHAPGARLAYVSPSHQYPLAVTMSVPRRERLLEWATAEEAWILEDDYDAEFRYGGHPLPALQGLDRSGRVLYIGTFSKVLFPGLRLGYLIVPESLVEPFTTAHGVLGHRAPMPAQAILAEFIESGQFSRHLRHMRRRYADARAVLTDAAQQHLKGVMEIRGAQVGLHVVGRLHASLLDTEISERAAALHLSVPPITAYYSGPPAYSGLVLGYGHLDAAAIRTGMERLAIAIEGNVRRQRRSS